jgi:hypothetical protein
MTFGISIKGLKEIFMAFWRSRLKFNGFFLLKEKLTSEAQMILEKIAAHL